MKSKGLILLMCGMLFLGACGSGNASSETSDTGKEQERNNLTIWNQITLDDENQCALFADFYAGEKAIDGVTVPVLYNDDIQLVFMGDYVELTKNDTKDSYTIELPNCSCGDIITLGRMQIQMVDVNKDDIKDLVFTETVTGTCRIQMVDIVDGKSMDVIPIHYTAEDLAGYSDIVDVSGFETASNELVVDTASQDYRYCTDDGTIVVETGFGFAETEASVNVDIVGVLRGELLYQQETGELILDENSVQAEWTN